MKASAHAAKAGEKVALELVRRWKFGVIWDTFDAHYLGERGVIGYSSALWTRVWFITLAGQVVTLKVGTKKTCRKKWLELRAAREV